MAQIIARYTIVKTFKDLVKLMKKELLSMSFYFLLFVA